MPSLNFTLYVLANHHNYLSSLTISSLQIEAEERERKEKANFKAQEASVLQKEPFVAHHEPAKPTGMAEGG